MSFLPLTHVPIDTLLARREGQLFDRKSVRIEARDLAKDLIAFANADGGEIVIGVHGGKVEGVSEREEHLNDLVQASIDFCVPPVRTAHHAVPCQNSKGLTDYVVLITIDQSDRIHQNRAGKTFLRVGDETRELGPEQHRQLLYDKGEQSYEDELLEDFDEGFLDNSLVARLRSALALEGAAVRVANARHLARKDRDGNTRISRAGVLLLYADPARFLPVHGIRFVRYEGTEIAVGASKNISANRRYEGPLPSVVESVIADLESILRVFVRLNARTSTFENEPEYPTFAWREAIINAVTHRAYSVGGQMTEIRLFDDRLARIIHMACQAAASMAQRD